MVKYNPPGGKSTYANLTVTDTLTSVDATISDDLTVQGSATLGSLPSPAGNVFMLGALEANETAILKNQVQLQGELNHSGTKLGFFNVTTVVQQALIADPSGGTTTDTEARTAINAILDLLVAYGLMSAT